METKLLHMIRIPTSHPHAVLAAGIMTETKSKTSFQVPKDENGRKNFSLATIYWNAERLKKEDEYTMLSSSVGPYMWGEDRDKLIACWMKAMMPQRSYAFNEKLDILQKEVGTKDTSNQFLVMAEDYINTGLQLLLEGSVAVSSPDAKTLVSRITEMIRSNDEARFSAYDYVDAVINWKDPIDIKGLLALNENDFALAMTMIAEYKREVYSYDCHSVGTDGLNIIERLTGKGTDGEDTDCGKSEPSVETENNGTVPTHEATMLVKGYYRCKVGGETEDEIKKHANECFTEANFGDLSDIDAEFLSAEEL